jgi:hypothetical protein
MSDTETPETPETQATEAPAVEKVSLFLEVGKEIKNELLAQNGSVREAYIEKEVASKLASRVSLVEKAFVELSNIKKDLAKIKPTQSFDLDGKVTAESYTKDQVDAKKKATERYNKIEKAITKAFDTADYTDLENLVK